MLHQLKATLDGVKPAIWRRLVVPSDFSLLDLHDVIQVAMGWEDCHLHDFKIGRQRYAVPDPEEFDAPLDETRAILRDVARLRSKLVYQYDFGDCWNHTIVVEKILENEEASLPTCTAGARACPPEDSGGPWGYANKLRALKKPNHEDYEDVRDWMGEDFDPARFEKETVNRDLLEMFRPVPARKRSARAK
jgi:hypothetical protein